MRKFSSLTNCSEQCIVHTGQEQMLPVLFFGCISLCSLGNEKLEAGDEA